MRGPRRQSRDAALQILFQLEGSPDLSAGQATELYFRELAGPNPRDNEDDDHSMLDAEDLDRDWIAGRVAGVVANRDALDARLADVSRNWRVERMSRLDRNILRLALWELLHATDAPRQVIFNEAIELAKRFGSAEAPAFINGVLESAAGPVRG